MSIIEKFPPAVDLAKLEADVTSAVPAMPDRVAPPGSI